MNRSLDQVVFDPLWPQSGPSPDPFIDLRHRAIAEVLQRIPEDAYAKLNDLVADFVWFIPASSLGAQVMPFPCTMPEEKGRVAMAKVLYLSPTLERRSYRFVVACVAHELAHIFLGHALFTGLEYGEQEKEAWALVIQWGFKEEERLHAKFYSRKAAEKKRLLAKPAV